MAFKLILFSCILVFANAGPPPSIPNPESLVNGNAEIGEFPHQVSVQINAFGDLQHWCGGTIISERWVLTAGHCILYSDDLPVTVKAGKHDISKTEDTEQIVKVVKSIIHESFKGERTPFDIALLKLETPLKFNNRVAAIELPDPTAEPSGDVVVSGWGSITTSKISPPILQRVTVPLIDFNTCDSTIKSLSHGMKYLLNRTNGCTAPLTGVDACNGDSGGPVIEKNEEGTNELVGVVSWTFVPCGAVNAPFVFVKVSDVMEWIETTMLENED